MSSLTVLTSALYPGLDFGLLLQAVQSVCKASKTKVNHVIILDDASDANADTVRDFLFQYSSETRDTVQVHGLPFRAGVGSARNAGLSLIDSEFFTVLDADDLFPAGSLDVQLAALQRNPSARYCLGGFETLHPDGSVKYYPNTLPLFLKEGDVARFTRDTGFLPSAPVAALWCADLVRRVGGYPGIPRDEDTCLKLAASSIAKGVTVNESVYVYRRGVDSQLTNVSFYEQAGPWCRGIAFDRVKGLVREGLAPSDLLESSWDRFLQG